MSLRPVHLFCAWVLFGPAAWLPRTAGADELLLTPSLSLRQEYNDNIDGATSGGRDGFVTTISSQLSLSDRAERYERSALVGVSLLEYLPEGRSEVGYQLQGSGNYLVNPRFSLSGSGGGSRDVRSSYIDTGTGLTTVKSNQENLRVGGSFVLIPLASLGFGAGVSRQSYDTAGYTTSTQYLGQVGMDLDLGRFWKGTKLTPQVGFTRDTTSPSRVDTLSASVNLSRQVNELWRFTLLGGGRYTRSSFELTPPFSGTASSDEGGWLGSFSLAYTGERFSGSLSVSHDLTTASGRIGDTERNGGGLSLSEKFTRNLTGTLGGSYSRNMAAARQFAAQGIDEVTETFQSGVQYELFNETGNRNVVTLGGGYSFSSTRYRLTHTRMDQNIYMLTLTWQHLGYL